MFESSEFSAPSPRDKSNFSGNYQGAAVTPLVSAPVESATVEAATVELATAASTPAATDSNSVPQPALEQSAIPPSRLPSPPILRADSYSFRTSQESVALSQAAADGCYGSYYEDDVQEGTRKHARPNAPFHVELKLDRRDLADNLGVEYLGRVTDRLDSNALLIIQYICHLLAPTDIEPSAHYPGGWIDLSEIAARFLPKPQSAQEARDQRAFIWNVVQFGAWARVIGNRSIPYHDKFTKEEIPTRLECSLWACLNREYQRTSAAALSGEKMPVVKADGTQAGRANASIEQIPVRVELVMNNAWFLISTHSSTAQYIMGAERLESLPAKQLSGAWARAMGMAYLHLCRTHASQYLAGTLSPKRRELLDMFPASVSPYQELFKQAHAKRAIGYFQSAEAMLAEKECGLIELPCPRAIASLNSWGKKDWRKKWLDERVDWRVGAGVRRDLEKVVSKTYQPKPRDLKPSRPNKPKPPGAPEK